MITMKKLIILLVTCVSAALTETAHAQSFDELANQYKSYDVQCQNSGANCWARGQVGEKLSSMGAYLCDRRDWYATPEAVTM